MRAICVPISSVARAVWPASSLTSVATTAKPRPASPARAASMVALSARRLVWPAMSEISLTTSPMRAVAPLSSCTRASVAPASRTAAPASSAEPCTCRPISCTDEPSSSEAAATVSTLEAACSAAAATETDWRAVSLAVPLIACAVVCSSDAARPTDSTMPPTMRSNPSAMSCMACWRCAWARPGQEPSRPPIASSASDPP